MTPEERVAFGLKMAAARKAARERKALLPPGPPKPPRVKREAVPYESSVKTDIVTPHVPVFKLIPLMEENGFRINLKEAGVDGKRIGVFKANEFQKELDDSIGPQPDGSNWLWHVIAKARQLGISTYIDLRLLAKCLTVDGTNAAIISHEKTATIKLLRKVHLTLEDLKARKVRINGKLIKTKFSSKFEITFPDMHSSLYVGTMGQRAFSRGDMLTDVHVSEVAHGSDPGETMSGIIGALTPSAEVFLESTANGMGGYFYDMVKKCEEGKGPAKLHFYPWNHAPEYSRPVPPNTVFGLEEVELMRKFRLTPEQMWWRHCKMAEYQSKDLFLQEFPLTLEESFIVSGACYFDKDSLRDAQARTKDPNVICAIESVGPRAIVRAMPSDQKREALEVARQWPIEIYNHPSATATYIISADCSEGADDADPSSALVFDRERCREVAWLSAVLDADEMSKALFALGQFYNWPWLAVEDGSAGLAVLFRLQQSGYPRLYMRKDPMDPEQKPKLGWHTDPRTRPLALGALRSMMKTRTWGVASKRLLSQCTTFCRHSDGGYRANSGCHDDDVMAAAIAARLHQILPVDIAPSEQERESRLYGPNNQPIVKHAWKTGY
jgi:hypothetical protein